MSIGIDFLNEQNVSWQRVSFLTTNGKKKKKWFKMVRTILIVFYWTNEFSEIFFKGTNFFFLYEQYYWTNDFSKRTILLNKWFTERSFIKKTNKMGGKWTIILRMNEINFFERLEKTHKMGRSRIMNEQNDKKVNVPISCYELKTFKIKLCKMFILVSPRFLRSYLMTER